VWNVAIEFALSGTISLQGKEYTTWSSLRAHLSKSLASAKIDSNDSLRGKVEVDEKSVVTNALASALAKATGARVLTRNASVPVTEDDLASSAASLKEPLTAFIKQNPPGKRVQFHPGAGSMMIKVSDHLEVHMKESPGEKISLTQLLMVVGGANPIPMGWTDFAAEVCEFTVQQGGFPSILNLVDVFSDKGCAEAVGCLRSRYVIHTLHALFVDECSDFKKLAPSPGFVEVVRLCAVRDVASDRLQTIIGQWDMTIKARTVQDWSDHWVKKFESFIQVYGKGELTYGHVFSCFSQIVYKGKLATAEMKAEAETEAESDALAESQVSVSGPMVGGYQIIKQ
jgi:hypothetical protein